MIQDEVRNVALDATPEQQEKARSLIGQPFFHLPGNPPQDKVLAIIDGYEIQTDLVEMVWNDKCFVDAVFGEGHYRSISSASQIKVLELAENLYK